MRTIVSAFVVAILFFSPAAGRAQGESAKGHCHNQGPDGRLVEADDLDTQLACDEEGGTWFRQPQHCHKLDANGKVREILPVRSQKECAAQHGLWMDHSQTK